MRLLDFSTVATAAVVEYQSNGTFAASLGDGSGPAHFYLLRFDPGGQIGPHRAGFAQLLVPITGTGWAAGSDGQRRPLSPGRAAFFASGEVHSKGSDEGMSAVMIQVSGLEAPWDEGAPNGAAGR
jgi:quercetin dioxygenase-like cupin family protein